MTSASGHWNKSGFTLGIDEYSSNGWKYGQASAYWRMPLDYVPTTPFEFEFELISIGNYDMAMFFNDSANRYLNFQKTQNKVSLAGNNNNSTSLSDFTGIFTLKVYTNKAELYRNSSKILEVSLSSITPLIALECGTQNGRWIQIKDFKIRVL